MQREELEENKKNFFQHLFRKKQVTYSLQKNHITVRKQIDEN